MPFKISHLLIYLILCFSLLFIYHEFSKPSTIPIAAVNHRPSTNRKMLSSQFDFTPFLKHHHHHHHRHQNLLEPVGGIDGVIDPRYGVEKRLVPTGPNPLHH
ncbi:hypothetical protein L6452_18198 [Arctium lappa]|uniref:Uncharacterized protein n=1 Tax=Arctium lappa TaxID=4217 RepID=A0ACB9C5S9_ARCLA|nr:hypothetical protein L6452_18198 [Arctium lappa]